MLPDWLAALGWIGLGIEFFRGVLNCAGRDFYNYTEPVLLDKYEYIRKTWRGEDDESPVDIRTAGLEERKKSGENPLEKIQDELEELSTGYAYLEETGVYPEDD
jgi:hypothetical protein